MIVSILALHRRGDKAVQQNLYSAKKSLNACISTQYIV